MQSAVLDRLWRRLPWKQRVRLRQQLRRITRPAWIGTLRRTTPLSDEWGLDRGAPIDRYYTHRFISGYADEIRGRVLEVQRSWYADRYGTGVSRCDILDIDPNNQFATLVADLATADAIPSDTFDCVILTHVLHYVFDLPAAVHHIHRILRPGGVLLATVPAVSRVDSDYLPRHGDYWRFTVHGCERLFGDQFGAEQVTVRSYGNVLTSMAFLTGLAFEDLSRRELDEHDSGIPTMISIRARKPVSLPS